AALVSENKVLAHPASIDSIPTSAGQEDHVSMGNAAGLKSWQVLGNVERALAIELLAGAQGVEFLAPLEPGAGVAAAHCLVRSLLRLREDETLLVQSGKPVGVFRTYAGAPRVLIANSLLVPRWATWDEFRRLEALGLTMFGQMTAGSWIYIGTQGILQGTY